MKKIIALLLVIMMVASLAACGNTNPSNNQNNSEPSGSSTTPSSSSKPSGNDGVMSYAEYMAAEAGEAVVVEFYIQATQGWWFNSKPEVNSGVITVYGQTEEGGYFAYEAKCDEATGNKLTAGTKVRISGEKAVWDGEVEIMNGTLQIVESDPVVFDHMDATALLGTDELIHHMNKKVAFNSMTVVASTVKDDENEYPFLYKWNGSGSEGDDLYFNVALGDQVFTFCVESYLCGVGSEAYEAVRGLQIGDVIDIEGFMYWYNNPQTHVTSVKKVMTFEQFIAAEDGEVVSVDFYVQATQGWWFDNDNNTGKVTIYGQNKDGGFFAYEAKCDEETGNKLVPGTKVRVTGEKATWEGEIEIMYSTVEILAGETWIADALDVTDLLGTEELEQHMNKKVSFKGMTVVACNNNGDAFQYKWNGTGSEGDDLYFCVSINGQTYTFVVESYLCGVGSETYEAVRNLKVGDVIDMEGFLYWYAKVQPHIFSVAVAA